MTRRDFLLKWLLYALALLPVLVVGLYILPRYPLWGTIPALLPVAAIVVAVLEGHIGGAGFGLFVGMLYDAFIPGPPGAMTLGLSLLCLGAGALARYGVRQDLAGCLLCSAGALTILNLLRVVAILVQGRSGLLALLKIAGCEVFWSLLFTPLIYVLFRAVYRRVPQASVF